MRDALCCLCKPSQSDCYKARVRRITKHFHGAREQIAGLSNFIDDPRALTLWDKEMDMDPDTWFQARA
jgi:hypothetical protein